MVSEQYGLPRNDDAYEPSLKFCIPAFPNTAPVNWAIYGVETRKPVDTVALTIDHEGQVAGYDWSFSEDPKDACRQFVRPASTNRILDWDSSVDFKVTHDKDIKQENPRASQRGKVSKDDRQSPRCISGTEGSVGVPMPVLADHVICVKYPETEEHADRPRGGVAEPRGSYE